MYCCSIYMIIPSYKTKTDFFFKFAAINQIWNPGAQSRTTQKSFLWQWLSLPLRRAARDPSSSPDSLNDKFLAQGNWICLWHLTSHHPYVNEWKAAQADVTKIEMEHVKNTMMFSHLGENCRTWLCGWWSGLKRKHTGFSDTQGQSVSNKTRQITFEGSSSTHIN